MQSGVCQDGFRSALLGLRAGGWGACRGGNGTILYAQEDSLIGRCFPITPGLRQAFAGKIVANYDRFDVLDGNSTTPAGPLLEIYNPILQPWSGGVVAVIEFYERAEELEATLAAAKLRSWAAVAAVTSLFFLALSAIVLRGSRTIDRQASDLNTVSPN